MRETAGLRGCTAVVTRPAEQAEALAGPLRGRGATVRVRPLVRIGAPADGGAALAAAVARLSDYDWVVFTSANAVHGTVRRAGPGARWPRVACVGEATARAARESGLAVAVIPEVFTGAALPRAMAEAAPLQGARVLWPRASGAGAAVADGLRSEGAEVAAIEAYRTLEDAAAGAALRRELAREPADIVAFTSPSGVRAFGRGYRGAVAVIGSVTERVARAAALDVQVQPAVHTMEALADAIATWWREGRSRP